MKKFLSRFGSLVTGTLSGFDRLVFRGHLSSLMRPGGLHIFLHQSRIRLLDFPKYAIATTEKIKRAAFGEAEELKRPVQYLDSPRVDKEDLAREILAKDPVKTGLICVLTALEPCKTFEYHRSTSSEERGYRLRNGKCLHLYKYYMHPQFGFMHARIQTWFPFNIQIYVNGREWLAQQLDAKSSTYEREDNCFTFLSNPTLAQNVMNRQLATDWPKTLGSIARAMNPWHPFIFKECPMDYYWSAYQTEWATDLMFKSPQALAEIYPGLVQHAMMHFQSPDVMRFLGGKVSGNFKGEITSSFKNRPEGVRVKHWLRGNSVKMYDKAGSVLRVESTIGNTSAFKVLRPPHDEPEGKLKWQPLRKGVGDLHRRAQVSQKANDTYLDALSVVEDTTPCSVVFDAVSRPVVKDGRRTRALRLSSQDDLALLQTISRGEFASEGFRNRDVRLLLHPQPFGSPEKQRQWSAKVSRLFRILRAHGLIVKVQKTHRYRLTATGHLLTAALFATRSANVKSLLQKAA